MNWGHKPKILHIFVIICCYGSTNYAQNGVFIRKDSFNGLFSCQHLRFLKCLQYWWFWTWLILIAHVLEKVIQNSLLLTSLIFFWQVHSTFKVKNSGLTCKVRCKRHIQLTTSLWTRELHFPSGCDSINIKERATSIWVANKFKW